MKPNQCIRFAALLGASLLFGSAACKVQEPQAPTTETTGAIEAAPHLAREPVKLVTEDKEFVTKAAQIGMIETTLGRHVAAKASSPEVRAFGERMLTEHGRAHEELKAILANKGIAIPAEIKKEHREEIAELSELSGPKLDKEYASEVVEAHEKDVDEFRKASKTLRDPELREWATRTLSMLEGHLAAARAMKSRIAR
jgi:putative membrane protein